MILVFLILTLAIGILLGLLVALWFVHRFMDEAEANEDGSDEPSGIFFRKRK